MAKPALAIANPGSDTATSNEAKKPDPLAHLQREWYGVGNALCGAPADPAHIPVDLAIANPGALQDRRLCAKCVSRFHRIGSSVSGVPPAAI